MTYVLRFDAPGGDDADLVGGKGANLGRLTQAGFPVPVGFTVTTGAYREFLDHSGLGDKVTGIVAGIDYDDAPGLEQTTAEIRALIHAAEIPAGIATELLDQYRQLGSGQRVAVRSSGTAEDLEGASFAGQHDTYLHIRGGDDVLDAVKRCWASLWTARATAYRQHKGFDQESVGIAVVVQAMVDAEVSGVMFTANPITAITDEICINASWGLGEAVVSGLVTPDAFTLDLGTLRVKEKTLGSKEQRIRLDDGAGQGTVTEPVDASERESFSLSDAQAAELGELGRRVMAHYDGLPQDTEWALAGGSFYLLQARPVTGANFSWDEEVADWQPPPTDDDAVWSRLWSDDGWTGAVTPLFYSHRAHAFQHSWGDIDIVAGWREPAEVPLPYCRYYRGKIYWNTERDDRVVMRFFPPRFRPLVLSNANPFRHEELLKAPFSYAGLVRTLARIHTLAPAHGATRWVKVQQDYIDNRREEAKGRPADELRLLSDEALVDYIEDRIRFENQYCEDIMLGYMVHWIGAGALLAQLVGTWYDGDNPGVLIDLLTGTTKPTFTTIENRELWKLADEIRSSPELTELFRAHEGAEFLARLPESEAGRAFQASYETFLAEYGHRGHAERDTYFPRRVEDPMVDYRALSTLLNLDAGHDPMASEEASRQRKQAAFDEIVANLSRQPLGFLKVEIFKILNAYNQTLLIGRDDQRAFVDIATLAIKEGFLELNRRMMERGQMETERDFYFLGRHELYALFRRGTPPTPLERAKIAGRKQNFDLVNSKEVETPTYLVRNQPVELDQDHGDGANLKGLPTSGGIVTATARVVKNLEEIGRVGQGEVMVCNATDPGWTPVFMLLAGAVFETGGAFAHCSCLSREYGIPAVQVPGALHKIPDGATITLNGNTGAVTIHTDTADD